LRVASAAAVTADIASASRSALVSGSEMLRVARAVSLNGSIAE
jgi:hypothetical protein